MKLAADAHLSQKRGGKLPTWSGHEEYEGIHLKRTPWTQTRSIVNICRSRARKILKQVTTERSPENGKEGPSMRQIIDFVILWVRHSPVVLRFDRFGDGALIKRKLLL